MFGSGSAIALARGTADTAAETAVLDALAQAVQALVAPWIPAEPLAAALAGGERRLMRWGAAFPVGAGLDPSLCFCPASRIGFCGDYVAGPGFGRLEGALRSAEALAEQLGAHGGA